MNVSFFYNGAVLWAGPGTAFNTQGRVGSNGNVYANTNPVDLRAGDPLTVTLVYNALTTTLSETLFDQTTHASFTTSYTDNLASEVAGGSALVGFTGGTGDGGATQTISNFSFTSTPEPATVYMAPSRLQ